MKIEFQGSLSLNCKKELKNACVVSCVLYVAMIVFLITYGAIGSSLISNRSLSSLGFIKYFPFVMVPCGIAMCVMVIIDARKGYKEPACIEISEDKCVSAKFDDGSYFWSFDDVSRVRDKGECYVMKVKKSHHVSTIICQKNLLTKGTLKDFEELFSSKLKA